MALLIHPKRALATARDFDGVDDDITFTGVPDLLTGSIAFWHNAVSLPPVGTVDMIAAYYQQSDSEPFTTHDKNFYYWPITGSDRRIRFRIFDGAGKVAGGTTNLSANIWYHVAGTIDGTNIRLYHNGTLQTTTAAGNSFDFTDPSLRLAPDIATPFEGASIVNKANVKIAGFAVWNVVLSVSEIPLLAAGVPPVDILPGNIVLRWPPEPDFSWNGNRGVVVGTKLAQGPPQLLREIAPRRLWVPSVAELANLVALERHYPRGVGRGVLRGVA